jgi:anti-sigma factor RsiW
MPHIEDAVLHAYLDGAAAPGDAARIDAHVKDCERCRARVEDVREVRERASGLLASLEPGPIHAPAFAELEARAARRGAGAVQALADGLGEGVDAADGGRARARDDATPGETGAAESIAGVSAAVGSTVAAPWWRRPSLAWAASLALAFGLGWLLRAELGAPAGLLPGPAASFEQRAATASDARAPERDELPSVEQNALAEAPSEAGTAVQEAPVDAVRADTDAAGRAAEQAAAPESPITVTGESPLVGVVPPPGAPPAAGEAFRAAQAADPPAVGNAALPDVAGPPAAATPQPQVLGARAEEVGAERFELEAAAGAMSFATADAPGRYLPVSGGDVEHWLGAPPRRLPELTLLSAEVGPPPAAPDGPVGSPVVRLVYRSENGQEITLTQQLAAAPPQQLPVAGTERGGAPVDPDARLSAEAARRRAAADREVLLRADMAADDLPATVVEPDGMVTYRWRDADGYLLALSGLVDADVLRALADRVR